jgi:hypothetical protein
MFNRFLILFFLVTLPAFAQNSDQPHPGEQFPTYFARITRGGGFPGIYLSPPLPLQQEFLKTIRIGYWVGRRDRVARKLAQQGVDLWGDWYVQRNSFSILFKNEQKKALLIQALQDFLKKDEKECTPQCPSPQEILNQSWTDLSAFSHQEFVKSYILALPIFGGKTILQHLGALYQFPADEAESSTKVRILSDRDFTKAVKGIGYVGPIYFRGITAPDPQNPKGHIILLNDDLLLKYSPFDSSLIKTLELAGILTHEFSHVFQDLKGASLGYDIEVRSAEGALMIEGSAEFLAEQAMTEAALSEAAPSALELFVASQAEEIVTREGNESSGQLFPYTVGLPFAAALYNLAGPAGHDLLTKNILQFLGGTSPLNDWFSKLPSRASTAATAVAAFRDYQNVQ